MSKIQYRLTTLSDGQQIITASSSFMTATAVTDDAIPVSNQELPDTDRAKAEEITQKLHTHMAKLDTISGKLTFIKKGKTSSKTK